MKKDDDEPKLWVTALKLLLLLTVLIGGVAGALIYASKIEHANAPSASKTGNSWGIVTDSPLRK